MSILIRGIDLPEAYTSAWLTVFECVDGHTFVRTHKVSAEQIQAIPPHGRLIDADKLLKKGITLSWSVQKWMSEVDIGLMPTIIEAEEGEAHD